MKNLINILFVLCFFGCSEEIQPSYNDGKSDVLTVQSDTWEEVTVTNGAFSLKFWTNPDHAVSVKVPRGTIEFHACYTGIFEHDGNKPLVIKCQ